MPSWTTPFHFQKEKKLQNSDTKHSQVTASLYTKIYKFAIFKLLSQTTAHLSLQKHNMPEPMVTTRDNWPWLYKEQKNCPKLKSFIQLKTMPQSSHLESLPWSLWNLWNLSHFCHGPKEWKTFHSISQRGWQMILITLIRWEMQPHWMQNTVLTTFIEDPLPISPCKRSWHLTQDPKRRPTSVSNRIFALILSSNQWVISKCDGWVLHSLRFQSQLADLLPFQRLNCMKTPTTTHQVKLRDFRTVQSAKKCHRLRPSITTSFGNPSIFAISKQPNLL